MPNRTLYRPEPVLRHDAQPVNSFTPPRQAAVRLRQGTSLLLTDAYGAGEEILTELERLMPPPLPEAPYAQRQAHRRALREASLRLLAPITNHRLALRDARDIGFLRELYPERSSFVLPYIQVQELHGAWGRYQEGVHLALLGHRIHPFFGTYVPTRVTHLELFGTWLSQYRGPRARAIDVGTGCGVMAFMLCRSRFEQVLATDSNPNAIESVSRELRRLTPSPPITLYHGDLLGNDSGPADVIAFNPPWMQGEVEGPVDAALYFREGLFERFFDQSLARLSPDGRVVLVFSNIMQLVQPELPHPILSELERGRLRLVQKLHRRVKPAPDERGQRRRTREEVEVWELAKA